jgi:hypothetical protein
LDRFLNMYAGIDQPFTPEKLAEAMEEDGLDEAWAEKRLIELEAEGRVYRSFDGQGWHSRR